eukprot:COSAG02_NODE_7070_length_3200_cov_2.047082_2_plen_89_part_00
MSIQMEVWDDTPGDENDLIGVVNHRIELAELTQNVRHLDQPSSAPADALVPPARCLVCASQPNQVRSITTSLCVVWYGNFDSVPILDT